MLGDRNTFRPDQGYVPQGARSLDGDAEDRAQEHFGNLVDDPTLVARFEVAQLPAPPWSVEVKTTTGAARIGSLHPVRVAVGWDGAQVFEGAPVTLAANQTYSLEVSAPRGMVLEVWADAGSWIESDASEIESVQVLPLSTGRARARDRADAPPVDARDPLGLKTIGVAVALAAVLGLAIWFGIGRNVGGG